MLIHAWDTAPYGRMLLGRHGVRLTVLQVDAKVKDDPNPAQENAADAAASPTFSGR